MRPRRASLTLSTAATAFCCMRRRPDWGVSKAASAALVSRSPGNEIRRHAVTGHHAGPVFAERPLQIGSDAAADFVADGGRQIVGNPEKFADGARLLLDEALARSTFVHTRLARKASSSPKITPSGVTRGGATNSRCLAAALRRPRSPSAKISAATTKQNPQAMMAITAGGCDSTQLINDAVRFGTERRRVQWSAREARGANQA